MVRFSFRYRRNGLRRYRHSGLLTINNILLYLVLLAISGGIAFVLTTIVWKEDPEDNDKLKAEKQKKEAEKAAEKGPLPTVIKCSAGTVAAPVHGKLIDQKDIPDETFAGGVLGAGLAIDPDEGIVVSPSAGTISTVAETGHAVGITTDSGMEILIHIGIDTVKMEGRGFETFVKENDKVTPGQKLVTFDRELILQEGYSDDVVVLLTNSDDYTDVKLGAEAQK